MPEFALPRPKVALQQAARFPDQVLPAGVGRPLSNVLSQATDALPDIQLPAGRLPALPTPAGMGALNAPPTPKAFVQRAETVLPAGVPRMSGLVPDITLPKFTTPFGVGGGGYRETPKTSAATNGTIRQGGYRSI